MNRNIDRNIDKLLADVLTPDSEPGEQLNAMLLGRAKEETWMKEKSRNNRKLAAAAAVAVAVMAVGGGTTYAAWRYLLPEEAATEIQDKGLANAFAGEDANLINETQTYGRYRVTFIGLVSGKSLSDRVHRSGGEVLDDRTYWLMAVEHADGTPMPESSSPEYDRERFLSSPFIQGLNPGLYNIYTLDGGYTEFVEDGVLYRMADCNNLEMFADKEIYLGMMDETSPSGIRGAYDYDEKTGKISRNEAYEGCNALFTLPIDASKADPVKAEAYLQSLEKTPEQEQAEIERERESLPESQRKEIEEGEAQMQLLGAFADTLTVDNIDRLCTKSNEAVIDVDWNAEWVEFATSAASGEGASKGSMQTEYFKELFPDEAPRICVDGYSISGGADGKSHAVINVLRMYEDGTITYADYIPKGLEL